MVYQVFSPKKRALGYKFNTGVEECKQVDKYFCKINLDKKELTKDIVLDYCKRKDNESISTQSKRIFTIKLFQQSIKVISVLFSEQLLFF